MARSATKNKPDDGAESEPVLEAESVRKVPTTDELQEQASKEEAAPAQNAPPWAERPRTYEEGLSQLLYPHLMRHPESHTLWRVKARSDHRAIDTLQPEYLWGLAGDRIQPGDRVELTNDNFDYLVEILIIKRRVDIKCFEFHVLSVREFDRKKMIKADLTDCRIELKGGAAMYCVVRRGDILKAGFITPLEAEAWLQRQRIL